MKHKYNKNRFINENVLCKGYIITTLIDDNNKIPCFHIIDTDTFGIKYDCCIQLQNSNYYSKTRLTKSLKAYLIKYLSKRIRNCFNSTTISGWKDLCYDWIAGNYTFNINTRRPKYETLFIQQKKYQYTK